ncbi:zinc finger-containing ubiquitin peptidase 1 isoform X2 [Melanotaenia boesemani]|uniref:zinc finger-containing ubiquitin peptidase 1 isoform X2 n=1 Tax=Melanotaenia boesemani TaxID=1250792 RepID=UPI001C04608F|nr:zinc finger-containing ubiquitin peptidase 1 isoform X2 [Melanotaenia boesemani]
MLICELCGEEMMTEEEMKSHLLLGHLDDSLRCPFCCLAAVSYHQLCLHIQSAHPEDHANPELAQGLASSGSSATTNTGVGESGKSCVAGDNGDAAEATATSLSMQSWRQNSTAGTESSWSGETATIPDPTLISQNPETTQDPVPCWKEHCDGLQAEPSTARVLQQKKRERILSCPMCSLVCSSAFILQEHVELHLQEQSSAPGRIRFECPMCSVVCSDSFSLQEHVELHFDQTASSAAGGLGWDLRLARQLQQEEEAQQEREQFKKLQKHFGLDGSGGYRRQMERNMERAVASGLLEPAQFHSKRAEMMESLASGVDDGRTRTQGVMGALYDYYQTENRDCIQVWLSAETDHFSSSPGDAGWGCGFRNFQMLLSSLHRTETYSSVLTEKKVPSIPELQRWVEEGWKEGLDPRGAAHFNQRLQGTRAWIGATEIYVLLTSLGISACIIDFHQPTGAGDTHPQLFDWVKQYFSQSSRSSRLPPRVIQTGLPPVYLQHQGHSRCIVGVEQKKNGSLCLLLLDPGSSASDSRKLLRRDSVSTSIRRVRKFLRNLKHKQYQLVAVQGVLTAEDKQVRIQNSRTLCAERIP